MNLQQRKQWIELAKQLYNVREQRKSLEKQEELLLNDFITMSNNKPFSAGSFSLERTYRKGTIDYALVKELEGIDLDIYRKPYIPQWKLTITKV